MLNDFLILARELISKENNDINIRTSINRSYYGAYHYCLNHIGLTDGRNLTHQSGGVHQGLIDHFKYGDKTELSISYILTELKRKRTIADYKLNEKLTKEEAHTSIEQLEKIIAKLDSQTKTANLA